MLHRISNAPTSNVISVSPALARNLRDTCHFELQRPISEGNVKRLAHEMEAGRFIPGLQVYLCVLPDGRKAIVNGNHTLEAVARSGISLLLTITEQPVATIEEAGRIYAVFDTQKVRSWSDSLRGVGKEEVPFGTRLVSAVALIERKFSGTTQKNASRPERLDAVDRYLEAASRLQEAVHGGTTEATNMMRRAGILSVALETSLHQPSMSIEFWGRVAHDDGLKKGDPEKALLSWLRNQGNTSGTGSQVAHARAAALAWNAAFKGEAREMIKPNAMTEFYLFGTPHTAGARRPDAPEGSQE